MSELEDNGKSYDSFHEMLESMGFKRVVAESPDKIPDGYKVIVFQSDNERLFRTVKSWVYKQKGIMILNDDSKEAFNVGNIFAIITDKIHSVAIPEKLKNLKISSNLDFSLITDILDEQLKH